MIITVSWKDTVVLLGLAGFQVKVGVDELDLLDSGDGVFTRLFGSAVVTDRSFVFGR